jgi:hypothetical protein
VKDPKEELRLITSTSELKIGMLVELRACRINECNRAHRFILTKIRCHWAQTPRLPAHDCRQFSSPNHHHYPNEYTCFCSAIHDRMVYEVREKGQSDDNERREILDFQKDAEMRIRKPVDVRDR